MAPYPLPAPSTGSMENPGRQPAIVQAIGLLAGFCLFALIVFAAGSGDFSLLIFALTAGCSGLVLGLAGHAFARTRRDEYRRPRRSYR